nr:unnamed protein product [Digitaria exilis]
MKCHHLLLCKVLLRRDTTWVTLFLKKNLKSSWLVVMMLKHKRLPKKLPRRPRFKQTILGTNFYLRWAGGKGLGSERRGRADPIMAGDVKKDHLGVGAVQPGEVTSEDDIYEQYKKRMMLGYRYRPNPLNNPRKAYY